ncbi:MAG: DUF1302 family protein [Pseudomonadota bacterium]
MKKKALALSVLAGLSTQAAAFQFDTSPDWNIRWDNTLRFNVQSRLDAPKGSVVNPEKVDTARINDDGDFSVNRRNGGISSARVDLISQLDVVWKRDYGFRISGAGWYDFAYDGSDNPTSGTLPRTGGQPFDYSWAGLTYKPGEYSDEAQWLHYRGGELLDAFVFGNWDIGDTVLGVRAGRHTIFWGQSLLANGAITGIAGSMTALDSSKGLSVPGSEAQELFMPSTKISTVWQLTDNFTFNGYYEFNHRVNRLPETGSYWSPREVLTENSQCFVLVAGTATAPRSCFKVKDNKFESSGEYGINLQYSIEAWGLETSWVYINGSDRTIAGVYGTFGGIDPETFARFIAPIDQGGANAAVIGEWGWVFKKDVETFGIALSKEMFDISFGMDIVYRKGAGLNPDFLASLTGRPGQTPADFGPDPDDYPGAVGDVYGVVINGLGFLNGEWGLWDGGTWIFEYTTSWLDKFTDNKQFADEDMEQGRVTTQIAGIFRPTWFQVFPGWDMTIPITFSYGVDGEQPPQGAILEEELGNASIGVEFKIDEVWEVRGTYISYFGPTDPGTTGTLNDRDALSFTVKRTW